ncbi:MAG: S-methyl-5'-thioadenosine phosphorylase [Chloroflexi bacterium]|nr:S-methyl-5'-thioadenosine phosphorylase [Chloroflexota bacterium]
MPQAKIGVIGGSGLYEIEGLRHVEEVDIKTPFGPTSDSIVVGEWEGAGLAFLPRHGKGHRIPPSDIPYRANIFALKTLGVENIIAVNSVGSFKDEIKPGHLLIPDQVIDRTAGRASSFFREDIVAHIPFAQPFCAMLSRAVYQAARDAGATVHRGGTYIAMEGPAFSTRAESRLYKSWGADVIGMTALPEARLAREAEMCYAVVACVTDYDSWQEKAEPLTVELILATMRGNIEIAKQIICLSVTRMPDTRACQCAGALKDALVTPLHLVPPETRAKLGPIIGKYLKE